MPNSSPIPLSPQLHASFAPILAALGLARAALADAATVVAVLPGYDLERGGEPIPAVAVAVWPDTPAAAIDLSKLSQTLGVPCVMREATPEEQIMALRSRNVPTFAVPSTNGSSFEQMLLSRVEQPDFFAPPRVGRYEPLDPTLLVPIDEAMQVTICVSPEAGWSELEQFLIGVRHRLTIGMYQFTAPHIFAALKQAVSHPDRRLDLILHPIPERPSAAGIKANDLEEGDIIGQIGSVLDDRFQMAWATIGSGGLWASAYHIKVAVRDDNSIWLSSGNWQSSNQPAVYPFVYPTEPLPTQFQRKYNREYHAIILNDALARIFGTYLRRDYELTKTEGTAQGFSEPDLFVADDDDAAESTIDFAAPMQLFPPLRINRRVKVMPLLTPDNYAEEVIPLIQSARRSVWFQNQYINYRNTGEDFNEMQQLISALKEKVDQGLDVRIICRDSMKPDSVNVLLALGFPLRCLRFQAACHNKAIFIDGERVVLGSHNWSNEGIRSNRDASLLFDDPEIAGYLAQIYEYDWNHLARARPKPNQPRVAGSGEANPPGRRRVPYRAVYEDGT